MRDLHYPLFILKSKAQSGIVQLQAPSASPQRLMKALHVSSGSRGLNLLRCRSCMARMASLLPAEFFLRVFRGTGSVLSRLVALLVARFLFILAGRGANGRQSFTHRPRAIAANTCAFGGGNA